MSKSDSLHYKLCCEASEWVKKLPFQGYKYIAVELCSMAADNPDVWGTNGCESIMIEVKISRQDFLKDNKKFARKPENITHATGNFRYYLSPEGIIDVKDLPEKWGLLHYINDKIVVIKEAEYINTYNRGELTILSSIMRREGIKSKIFNYRKSKLNIKN